jgi:hypothetical protein
MADNSKSEHILQLTKDLLDDIELSRLSGEQLLLKTSRLARFVGSEETKEWLRYELEGYRSDEAISLKYMTKTGRWSNYEKKQGWWGPLAQQEASIQALKAQQATMRTPDVSGDYAATALHSAHTAMTKLLTP